MLRFAFCLLLAAQTTPWTSADTVQPADLAKQIRAGDAPSIIFVGFPVLYGAAHISGARLAGPASKPEGIHALQTAVRDLPRDRELVIYCGCCPMDHCPNIRPAYRALKEMGFQKVKVLVIANNMHDDWNQKGYPVERASGAR